MAKKKQKRRRRRPARRKVALGKMNFTIAAGGAASNMIGAQVIGLLPDGEPWDALKTAPHALSAVIVGWFAKSQDVFDWGIGQMAGTFISL